MDHQMRTQDSTTPEPGVYDGIPDTEYHADHGSLSSSGARKLLAPSTPAHFRWAMDNPQPPRNTFEVGTAAHTLVLGTGSELVLVDHDEWRTKAIKDEVAEIRASGRIPLKPDDYDMVHAMAEAIKTHPLASALFQSGVAEQSIYWDDPETGTRLRCRPDWRTTMQDGRTLIVDYKTSVSANPDVFARHAADYGYHQQHPWYADGVATALDLEDPAFIFCVQEKTAPYLVSVIELDPGAVDLGRRLNRQAIDLYATCIRDDHWPGYGSGITTLTLPTWATKQQERTLNV